MLMMPSALWVELFVRSSSSAVVGWLVGVCVCRHCSIHVRSPSSWPFHCKPPPTTDQIVTCVRERCPWLGNCCCQAWSNNNRQLPPIRLLSAGTWPTLSFKFAFKFAGQQWACHWKQRNHFVCRHEGHFVIILQMDTLSWSSGNRIEGSSFDQSVCTCFVRIFIACFESSWKIQQNFVYILHFGCSCYNVLSKVFDCSACGHCWSPRRGPWQWWGRNCPNVVDDHRHDHKQGRHRLVFCLHSPAKCSMSITLVPVFAFHVDLLWAVPFRFPTTPVSYTCEHANYANYNIDCIDTSLLNSDPLSMFHCQHARTKLSRNDWVPNIQYCTRNGHVLMNRSYFFGDNYLNWTDRFPFLSR